MTITHINRLRCAVTNTPGLAGDIVVGAALNVGTGANASGRRTFTAAEDGLSFEPIFEDGIRWETRTGCVYTHSTTTLTRGTLVDSSTGSAIALTSSAVVTLGATAKHAQDLEAVRALSAPQVTAMAYAIENTFTSGAPPSINTQNANASWIYRSPATSTSIKNAWYFYVPVGRGYYNCAVFGDNMATGTPIAQNWGRYYLSKIGTYTHHTSATKIGTWTTISNDFAFGGSYCRSVTPGDTCSFSATGSVVVLKTVAISNGGYAIVSIDGSYTAANRCPVFTSADYAAGRCRSTDVGKAYINTYAVANVGDYHIVLADGLADSAHAIVFEATGTKATASSDVRAHIGGVVGCSAADVGQSPGGAYAFANVEAVYEIDNGASAFLQVPEVENNAASTFEFLGDVHGAETVVSYSVAADGVSKTAMTLGTYTSGAVIRFNRVTTLASTDLPGTPAITKTTDVIFSASGVCPIIANTRMVFALAKRVRFNYPAMLPVRQINLDNGASENRRWTTASFGSYVAASTDMTIKDDVDRGNVPAYLARISGTHGHVAYVGVIDGEQSVNSFFLSSSSPVFLLSKSAGDSKIYFCRSNSKSIESFSAGQITTTAAGWGIVPA